MKRTILIAVILLLGLIKTEGQITYFNYYDHSVQYRQEITGWNGIASYSIMTNFYFVGDTLINGKWYYRQNVINQCTNAQPQFNGPLYVREDGSKKFYYYDFNSNSDQVSWDWNQYLSLKVGDPFPLSAWNCTVTAIDSVQVGSSYRKRWHGAVSQSMGTAYPFYIFEGLGWCGDICAVTIEETRRIVCYKKGSTQLTFVPNNPNCNYVTNVTVDMHKNYQEAELITVYPNPAGSEIYFDNLPDVCTLKVIGLYGETLSEMMITNKSAVNLHSMNPGIYFLHFYTNGENIVTKKLVVQ